MVDIDAEETDEQIYKAGDVREVSGLSYRQLNDWEMRGALPESKGREPKGEGSQWRKYTFYELFIIAVLAELKRRFDTPTEKLKFIKDSMVRQGISRLNALMFHVSLHGLSQWLLTDFEETFVMDSELGVKEMFEQGYFHSDEQAAYVLLNVTPLIQTMAKLLVKKDIPFSDEIVNALKEQKESDQDLLKKIYGKGVSKVVIQLNDDSIRTVKVTRKRSIKSIVEKLNQEHDYQKVSYLTEAGEVVYVEQTVTYKHEQKKKSK